MLGDEATDEAPCVKPRGHRVSLLMMFLARYLFVASFFFSVTLAGTTVLGDEA